MITTLCICHTEPEAQARDDQLSTDRPVSSDSPSYDSPTTSSTTLVLTEEEKSLLAAQGVSLPTNMPLTKVSLTTLHN